MIELGLFIMKGELQWFERIEGIDEDRELNILRDRNVDGRAGGDRSKNIGKQGHTK